MKQLYTSKNTWSAKVVALCSALALLCCTTGFAQTTFGPFTSSPAAAIPDDGYDGSPGSMLQDDIAVGGVTGTEVIDITVDVAITHTWVGDLTLKVVTPDGDTLTLVSRAGYAETVDDGSGCCGTSSDWGGTTVTFNDGGALDAENLDAPFTDTYFPNPGVTSYPTTAFADLLAGTMNGTWSLFVGDAAAGDVGTLDSWSITIVTQTPSITLVKTVGLSDGDGDCGDDPLATATALGVSVGDSVCYFYTVENTGDVTLELHDLDDDILGTLGVGIPYTLDPAAAAFISVGPVEITADVTNTAIWTSYNAGPVDEATASASAIVVIAPDNCDSPQGVPGFPSDPACEAAICAADPFCCDTEWDGICASEAALEAACSACLCEADAGTLTSDAMGCLDGGTADISATPNGDAVVPTGLLTVYLLVDGTGTIAQTASTPAFTVSADGDYTIHTLVYDPLLYDPSTDITTGTTTPADVLAAITEGGGPACGSLDGTGAAITVGTPEAGTFTSDTTATVCIAPGGDVTLGGTGDGNAVVPTGYAMGYVLTDASTGEILDASATASFTVGAGSFTIHPVVYDPLAIDPVTLVGQNAADVAALLVENGGTECGSLDLTGATTVVEYCFCDQPQGTAGFPADPACEAAICAADAFCCDTEWDGVCASAAALEPACQSCLQPVCNDPQGGPGYPYDAACEAAVCAIDDFCCTTAWDGICASQAAVTVECADCVSSTGEELAPNDSCADAITIECGDVVSAITSSATAGSDLDCSSGAISSPDVWYSFTGNGQEVTASLCGLSGYDTKIGIYTGSTCGALVCVDENDDACGLQSEITFEATYGEEYLIRVFGFGTAAGAFELAVTCNCLADAGTIAADQALYCVSSGGTATVTATHDGNSVVPTGYLQVYVLTSATDGEILDVQSTASFSGVGTGEYVVHTLVYDPLSIDLGTLPSPAYASDVDALLIQGGGDICGSLDLIGSDVSVQEEPVAGFTSAQVGGSLDVDFTNTSTGGGNAPLTYAWDFGDGNVSSDENPSNTYSAPGEYTVCLIASNDCDVDGDTSCTTVTVAPANDDPCGATALSMGSNGPFSNEFAGVDGNEPAPGLVGCTEQGGWCINNTPDQTVWFTFVAPASGNMTISTDGGDFDTQLAVYEASACGDLFTGGETLVGANDDDPDASGSGGSSLTSIVHLCDLTPGATYYVQLEGWGSAEGSTPITLTETTVAADFTSSATNLAVDFTDASTTSSSIVSWDWDFGDGNSSTDQDPSHTYSSANTYTVCLTVTDEYGCTSTFCTDVTVTDIPTSIAEAVDNGMDVYPNPSNGEFTVIVKGVSEADVQLNVLDVAGRVVYTEGVTLNGNFRRDLSLDVAKGSYQLQIATEEGMVTRRIVVQ